MNKEKARNYNKNKYENEVFPTRLRTLLEDRNIKQEELAKHCKVSRQSIGKWKDGETMPDILALIEIASFFDVSLDYLCGLSDMENLDNDIKSSASTLGLSERAAKTLYDMSHTSDNKYDKHLQAIEFLLNINVEKISDIYYYKASPFYSMDYVINRYLIDILEDLGCYVDVYNNPEYFEGEIKLNFPSADLPLAVKKYNPINFIREILDDLKTKLEVLFMEKTSMIRTVEDETIEAIEYPSDSPTEPIIHRSDKK